jgi:hypothetical protein
VSENVPPTNSDRSSILRQDFGWIRTFLAVVAAEFVGMILYAVTERSIQTFACELLLGLAAGLVGGLLGFIFGIPKTVTPAASASTALVEYQGNTNLEQISDWLAKILVGAGLVELKSIGLALSALGSTFGTHGCLGACGWIAAPVIVIGFSVSGFLLTYLWARIYMIEELKRSHQISTSPDLHQRGAA